MFEKIYVEREKKNFQRHHDRHTKITRQPTENLSPPEEFSLTTFK